MAHSPSAAPDAVVMPAPPTLSYRLARLAHQPLAVAGAIFLILVALVAIFAPLLGTVDPLAVAPARRARFPSAEAWFGTDMLGRDLYSRVIYGARVSLTVGLAVGVLAVATGLLIGTVSGFIRWLDPIIMRIMDGLMSIPGILLAIALLAVAPGTLQNVIIAIAASQVARVARLVRGEVLRVRGNLYVEAAMAAGTPTWRIMLKHVIPNILGPGDRAGNLHLRRCDAGRGGAVLCRRRPAVLGAVMGQHHVGRPRPLAGAALYDRHTGPVHLADRALDQHDRRCRPRRAGPALPEAALTDCCRQETSTTPVPCRRRLPETT